MHAFHRAWVTLAIVLAVCALSVSSGEAHKPITSPFTFNEHVFPILQAQCGACHVEGGIAPMSLLTHAQAVPWGESMRVELLAGHMPPWAVDGPIGRFQNAQALTARELNVLLTWVSGGTPAGDPANSPPAARVHPEWPLGPPDVTLPFPSEYTLSADTTEVNAEFAIATGLREAVWVRAIDIRPGNAAIVRGATVRLKEDLAPSAGGARPESVLAVWVPGDHPVALEGEGAFLLPANGNLVVSVHYRKTWEYERQALTDRSTIGLYLASGPAPRVLALPLAPDVATSADEGSRSRRADVTSGVAAVDNGSVRNDRVPGSSRTGDIVSYTTTMQQDLRALAIYPDAGLRDARVTVRAARPDGTSEELIAFRPKAGWARRYWFAAPVSLPRGTTITVAAQLTNTLLPPGALPPEQVDPSTVRLTLNVVAP